MRHRFSIGLSILAIGALAFASCSSSPDPAPAAKPPSAAAPPSAKDEDLIQGKWVCVEHSEDGVKVPGGGGVRAVFTAKEAKIGSEQGAAIYQYRLLGGGPPKRCDLTIPEVFTRHIAYELNGDTLILASHLEENQDTPAPKSISAAPGLSVSKFRRAELAAKEEKPGNAEEVVALAVLRQQLSGYRELFEKKKYEEILQEMIGPDLRRKLADSPEEKAQFLRRMKGMGESFAKLLAAIETQRPVFNAPRTRATYDVRLIHFDGLPSMAQLKFYREESAWYMGDR